MNYKDMACRWQAFFCDIMCRTQGRSVHLAPHFLTHCAYLWMLLIAIYLTGHLMSATCSARQGNRFQAYFAKQTIGVTVLTVVYAVWVTAGKTALLSLLLVGIYFLYGQFHTNVFSKQRAFHNLMSLEPLPVLLTFAVSFVVFALHHQAFIDPINGTLYALDADHAFYARIAQHLNRSHIETSTLDWVFPGEQAPSPYHYMEVWMIALASKLFAANAVHASKLIVFPVLSSIIYIGAIALFEKFSRLSWRTYLMGLAIFCTASFTIIFQKTLVHVIGGDVFQHTFASLPKLSFIYIYLIWAILVFQESNAASAVMVLTALGIIYPVILPSVYLATLVTLWYAYFRRTIALRTALSLSMLMGGIVLYHLIFYGMAHTEHSYALAGSTQAAAEYYTSLRAVITAINIIGSTLIKIIVTNLPYLVLIGVAAMRHQAAWQKVIGHPAAIFSLLLFSVPLLMWSALHFLFDSVQFWYLLYFPIIGIASYAMVGAILQNVTPTRSLKVCATLVLLCNIYAHPVVTRGSRLSHRFYTQAAQMISESSQANFAYIKAASDYSNAFEKSPTYLVPLHMLTAYTERYLPISLSVHETPLSDSIYARHREVSLIAASPFYRFVERQKARNEFVSLPNSQVAFIKQFHIQYLILSKEARPSLMLEELFDTVIEDADNGYKFIKLNI